MPAGRTYAAIGYARRLYSVSPHFFENRSFPKPIENSSAGVLWVAILFSGTLALGRAFERERQSETLRGLLMAPIERAAIYLGKLFALLILMALVEVVLVPIVVFRKRLLANAVGRNASVIFLLVTSTILVHRLLAYHWGVSASHTLSMDMAVMAGITACSGVIVPRLAWAALVPLAGVVASVVFPDRIAMIFSVMSLGTIVAVHRSF